MLEVLALIILIDIGAIALFIVLRRENNRLEKKIIERYGVESALIDFVDLRLLSSIYFALYLLSSFSNVKSGSEKKSRNKSSENALRELVVRLGLI